MGERDGWRTAAIHSPRTQPAHPLIGSSASLCCCCFCVLLTLAAGSATESQMDDLSALMFVMDGVCMDSVCGRESESAGLAAERGDQRLVGAALDCDRNLRSIEAAAAAAASGGQTSGHHTQQACLARPHTATGRAVTSSRRPSARRQQHGAEASRPGQPFRFSAPVSRPHPTSMRCAASRVSSSRLLDASHMSSCGQLWQHR